MPLRRILARITTPFTPGIARITIAVGGDAQAIIRYGRLFHADETADFDVQAELQQAIHFHKPPGVLLRPLAVGHTAASLLSTRNGRGSNSIPDVLRHRPGVTLESGLGRLLLFGWHGAKCEIDSSEFREFVRKDLLEAELAYHNGCIHKFQLFVRIGGSGATGAGGGMEIAKPIANILRENTNATVEIVCRMTGSATYFGMSGVHQNCGLTAAKWLAKVSAPADHPCEAYSLTLTEYPSCGTQKTVRDQFVLQTTQARFCREVEDHLARIAVNQAVQSPLGNVAIERLGFGRALPASEVGADVAAAFMPQIDVLLATRPDISTVDNLDVQRASQPLPRFDLEHIVARHPLLSAEEIFAAIKQPDERLAISVFLDHRDGSRVNLTRSKEIFATRCLTCADFVQRFQLFRTSEEVLLHELAQAKDKLADLRDEEVECDNELDIAIGGLKQQTFRQRLSGIWRNREQREQRLLDAGENSRANLRELLRQEAEVNGMEEAVRQVRGEIEFLEQRLNKVQATLSKFSQSSCGVSRPAWIHTCPLDDALEDLLEVAAKTSTQQVLQLLGACAARVTVAGLASTLESSSDRIEDLVPFLSEGQPAIQAPAWGGRCDCDDGDVALSLIVVPPLEADVEQKLREGFTKAGGHRVLAVADTCMAAVNVVHVSVRFPKSADAILTNFLSAHAQRAMQEDRAVHCPDGVDYLEKFTHHVNETVATTTTTNNSNTQPAKETTDDSHG